MNAETWIPLLAGLLGSLLTIVATKAFDYFNARREQRHKDAQDELAFRRELQKSFFARKMKATEELMAACNLQNIGASQMLQVLVEFRNDYSSAARNAAIFNDSLACLQEARKRMEEKTIVIDLYYDLQFDTSFLQYRASGAMFEVHWQNFLNTYAAMEAEADKTGPAYAALQAQMEQHRDAAHQSLDDLMTMYEEMIKSYSSLQRELRNAFRKLDV